MNPEEIQGIFFAECDESLQAAEAGLAACQAGTHDGETINAIFRAVHSIKGGAGAFGFEALQGYTHVFETLLSDVRDGTVALTAPLVDLLLRALDTLSDHVSAARGEGDTPADAKLLAELEAAQARNAGAAPVATAAEPAPAAAPAPVAGSSGAIAMGDDDNAVAVDLDSLLDSLTDDFAPAAPAEPAEAPEWLVHVRPHAGAMINGGEPVLLLRELARLGGRCVQVDCGSVPALDLLDWRTGYLGWTFAMPGSVDEAEVHDVFDFVGDDCGVAIGADAPMPPIRRAAPVAPAAPAAASAPAAVAATPAPTQPGAPASEPAPSAANTPAPPAPPVAGQSIRIDLVKLDRLIDTVGELVIAQAMLAQRLSNENVTAIEELGMLETLTRDIQESAMAIRAQPIGSVFSRVPRILRELAATTGKHVRLDVSGESTELDKTVIEKLGEPLTHLIRNAVDHGIESAEERVAAGKPAEGTVTLSAEHRSGRIHIRIADDGKGIDQKRVLAKAIEKGIVAPDAQLTREEIDHLIFAPGFSTAEQVSNISGRGVGMDVVRQSVKDLGGRITIESEQGKGTAFILTLPLTLAISEGMIINVGDQSLVVPLANVVESLRPGAGDVKGLGVGRQMLNVRGKFLPILPLHDLVGAAGEPASPENGVLVVVETEAAGQAALLVDGISDQRQFVIKSLETHYRSMEGVAGATILGDGCVALILDVDSLVANAAMTLLRQPLRDAA
ncbi:chemotaxis protein CheA [Novosphingobium flavum]|uniref:chemotaxis protein CheA n=1 Tax=Novosphingobium aerophilum TaxID=2839843 RepID=UPI00163A4A8B|nr:chemotaxis protein CheA [Novosphingobium aerophilum]MBC2661105.1 chemotaxis protein CheA [Novosphingobium aerophilum]